jgi:hypothetical protein
MLDAKKKFREGYILINRPFQFKEMKNPIQRNTIVWAYSEQPVVEKNLSETAKEEAILLESTSGIGFIRQGDKEDYIARELERIYNNPKNYDSLYVGDIIQSTIDGVLCRFYPDEYSILDQDALNEALAEDGYHMIGNESLYKIKEFRDKTHYLKSRGVDKATAEKWASLGFRDLVYYKPYYDLLKMFCRPNEIYPDSFYEEVEGVKIESHIEIPIITFDKHGIRRY